MIPLSTCSLIKNTNKLNGKIFIAFVFMDGFNKQIQKIRFDALLVKSLNDSDFDPKAQANSGLQVFYNSANPAVATILNRKIHKVG